MNKKLIFVLGMHRTGTSVLTGCLYRLLGLEENDSDNLMKATGDNPKGYFEDLRIVDLNERILKKLGYSWDTMIFTEHDLLKEIPYEFFIEANEILTSELNSNDVIVLKDPRICLVYPFWEHVVKQLQAKPEVKHIISIRNPYETALSEYKRATSNRPYYILGNKLDYSQRVWFTHYYELLNNINENFIICEFEKLIDEPRIIIEKISSYLSIKTDKNFVNSLSNDFLSKELRRNKVSNEFIDNLPKKDGFIYKLYRDLISHSESPVIEAHTAREILRSFEFMEHLKDYCYPIKEFPSIVKKHLYSKQTAKA